MSRRQTCRNPRSLQRAARAPWRSVAVSGTVHVHLSIQAQIVRRRCEGNMKLPRREFLQLAAGAPTLPAVSRITRAQAGSRPVRVLVLPPGRTGDISARLLGQWLSETGSAILRHAKSTGRQQFRSLPRLVVNAPPDGYTLFMDSYNNCVDATLRTNLPLQFHPRHGAGREHHPLYPRRMVNPGFQSKPSPNL